MQAPAFVGAMGRRKQSPAKTCVSVVTMMAPAVMVPAAPAPTIMVTPAAAVHVTVTVAVAMPASHLNHGVVLPGKRRDQQPGGSGRGQCKCRCKQRDTNQSDAFQVVSSHRMIAISDTISRLEFCSKYWLRWKLQRSLRVGLPDFPDLRSSRSTLLTNLSERPCGIPSPREW